MLPCCVTDIVPLKLGSAEASRKNCECKRGAFWVHTSPGIGWVRVLEVPFGSICEELFSLQQGNVWRSCKLRTKRLSRCFIWLFILFLCVQDVGVRVCVCEATQKNLDIMLTVYFQPLLKSQETWPHSPGQQQPRAERQLSLQTAPVRLHSPPSPLPFIFPTSRLLGPPCHLLLCVGCYLSYS